MRTTMWVGWAELGPEGLEAFRETEHVHLDARAERRPLWYPYGQTG